MLFKIENTEYKQSCLHFSTDHLNNAELFDRAIADDEKWSFKNNLLISFTSGNT